MFHPGSAFQLKPCLQLTISLWAYCAEADIGWLTKVQPPVKALVSDLTVARECASCGGLDHHHLSGCASDPSKAKSTRQGGELARQPYRAAYQPNHDRRPTYSPDRTREARKRERERSPPRDSRHEGREQRRRSGSRGKDQNLNKYCPGGGGRGRGSQRTR